MYFSANTGTGFHIWRQRFPDGAPEQVTSGATEEEGLAFAPDGRSFVTSVGTSQSTIWIHDSRGERQISSQGYGLLPSFSPDGKKLYYLLRSGGSRNFVSGELWIADLESGHRERLLPDFLMQHYDISRDGRRVVFVMADAGGNSPVWVAALDGRFAPRRLTSLDALRVLFRTDDELLFVGQEKKGSRFLYRMKDDGGGLQRVIPSPVVFMYSVSPDGKWVAAWDPGSSEQAQNSLMVYPVDGGAPITICNACASGGGPDRGHFPPLLSWSSDGTFLYLLTAREPRYTYAVPLRPGHALPALPSSGIRSLDDAAALPGARLISQQAVFAGPGPSVYAFSRVATQRNIYRIPVP